MKKLFARFMSAFLALVTVVSLTPSAFALNTPEGLVAVYSMADNAVKVSWKEAEGAESYNVHRQASGESKATYISGSNTKNTSYLDTNVKSGTYKYGVIAQNSKEKSKRTSLVTCEVPEIDLDTPKNLKVVCASDGRSLALTWDKVSGATMYVVYKSTDNKNWDVCVLKSGGSNTSHTDSSVSSGQRCWYKVAAKRSASSASKATAAVEGLLLQMPTGLKATYSYASNSIYFSWNAVESAESYNVHVNSEYKASTAETYYELQNVKPSTNYTFSVKATQGSIKGALATKITCSVPAAPAAPEALKAVWSASEGGVVLTWSTSKTATSYNIHRDGVYIATVSGTTYIDKSVKSGVACTYAVEGTNGALKGELCEKISFLAPPSAPTGISAVYDAATGGVKVSWSAASGATSYSINKSSDGKVWTMLSSSTSTNYTDKNTAEGSKMYYSVKASNKGGESAFSTAVLCAIPSTPAGVRAEYDAENNSIILTWNSSANATSYNVHLNSQYMANVSDCVYTLPDVVKGSAYKFKVKAVNGSNKSSLSPEVSCTVPDIGIPADLVAVYSSKTGRVTLSWNGVYNATGYNIHRDGVYIASSATNSYTETLAPGTYAYKVKATNADGKGKLCQEISVTVPQIGVPEDLTASFNAKTGMITIKWSAVPGATGYNIHRLGPEDESFTYCGHVDAPTVSFTDKVEIFGERYHYCVKAENTAIGIKGELCEDVCCKTGEVSYGGSKAEQVYSAEKGVSFAKVKSNVENTAGLCAAFVRTCLDKGGIEFSKSYGTPFSLARYLVRNGLATVDAGPISLKDLKPGDAIATYCDAKKHASDISKLDCWGLHIIYVTEVNVEGGYIRYSARNNNHCNAKMTAGELADYKTRCQSCGSSRNSKTVVIHLNSTKQPELSKATAEGLQAVVSWKPVENADGYRIYRKLKSSDTFSVLANVSGGDVSSFTDKTVKAGEEYVYTIRAYKGKLFSTSDKSGVSVQIPNTLTQPKLIGVKNENNGLEVKWENVGGAEEYELYRKTDEKDKWTLLRSLNANAVGTAEASSAPAIGSREMSYIDEDTQSGKIYYYTVKAKLGAKAGSDAVESKMDQTGEKGLRLDTPTITEALKDNGFLIGSYVKLTWKDSEDAYSYKIYRSVAGSGSYELIYSLGVTGGIFSSKTHSYKDKDANEATDYTYKVIASVSKDGVNYTSWDGNIRSTGYNSAPETPQGLTAVYDEVSGEIVVTWNSVEGAEAYNIHRQAPGETKLTYIGGSNTSDTFYRDANVQPGSTYSYGVLAENESGKSARCESVKCTTPKKPAQPKPAAVPKLDSPVLLGAESKATGIMVSWDKLTGAASYVIYRKTDSENWRRIGTAASTGYLDDTVLDKTTYFYTVCGVADSVEGSYDNDGVSCLYKKPATTKKAGVTSPAAQDASIVQAKLDKLTSTLGNSFFTKSHKACTDHYKDNNKNGCSNCANKNVLYKSKNGWFDTTGLLKPVGGESPDLNVVLTNKDSNTALGYMTRSTGDYANAQSCKGFAAYAVWYTFAQCESDKVTLNIPQKGEFNEKTMKEARPGDMLMLGSSNSYPNHAVMYLGQYSNNKGVETGILVLDSNWVGPCKVTVHEILYTRYNYVAINRASNYDIPGAPAACTAENTATGVKITWEAANGVSKYNILRSDSEHGKYKLIATVNSEISYTDIDETLTEGTTYYYTVRSVVGKWHSEDSETVSCQYSKTPVTKLSQPVPVAAENAKDGIVFSFKPVKDASSYLILRKGSGDSSFKDLEKVAVSKLTGSAFALSYTDKTAESGKTYSYTVKAVNGKVSSTNDKTGKTCLCLKTPGKVKTEISDNNSILLTWTPTTGAATYEVYRRTAKATEFTLLADGLKAAKYTDNSVVIGESYVYAAKAISGFFASVLGDTSDTVVAQNTLIAKCATVDTCLDVVFPKGTAVKSLPYAEDGSVKKVTLSADTTFRVSKIYKNTYGNYWYAVNGNGYDGFIFSGQLMSYSIPVGEMVKLTLEDKLKDREHDGKGEKLTGTIESSGKQTVRFGRIMEGDKRVAYAEDAKSVEKYTITGSKIDNNLSIGNLGIGSFEYCIGCRCSVPVATGKNDGKELIDYASGDVLSPADAFSIYKTVSFQPNGGNFDGSTAAKTVKVYDAPKDFPTPTRSGYTFAGWYTAPADGTKVVSEDVLLKSIKDGKLYAHWTVGADTLSGQCGDNATYTLSNGVLTISGTGPMWDFALNAEGTAIDSPWFSANDEIRSIVVESGISHVGEYAFPLCANVSSVSLPSTLRTIGRDSFSCLISLSSITLPEGLESIGFEAFGRSGLTGLTIPASVSSLDEYFAACCPHLNSFSVAAGNTHFAVEDGVLFNSAKTELLQYPCGKTGASYTVPGTVTKLCTGCFSEASLNSVALPACLQNIAADAFLNCGSLSQVTLPEGLGTVGWYAFCGTALTAVEIPASVTGIGNYAFGYFRDPIRKVEGFTVTGAAGTAAETYATENGFTFIDNTTSGDIQCGDNAYASLENGILTISGTGPMWNYSQAGIEAISKDSVLSAVVGEGITSIGDCAFCGLSNMSAVTLPSTLTSIGSLGFAYCTSLSSVTLPASLQTIGDVAFTGSGLTGLNIPANVSSLGDSFAGDCHSLNSITVDAVNTRFTAADSVVFSKDMTELILYPCAKTAQSYTVPSTVVVICNNAFMLSQLRTVTLPDGLIRIGFSAFYLSALESVELPSTLSTVGGNAFVGTTFNSVEIPDSVTIIGDKAFGYSALYPTVETISGFTIIGAAGTAAETYATENGFTFTPLAAQSGLPQLLSSLPGSENLLMASEPSPTPEPSSAPTPSPTIEPSPTPTPEVSPAVPNET